MKIRIEMRFLTKNTKKIFLKKLDNESLEFIITIFCKKTKTDLIIKSDFFWNLKTNLIMKGNEISKNSFSLFKYNNSLNNPQMKFLKF